MLHLIGRQKQGHAGVDEGPSDQVLISHILPRFLRRLRAIDRPHLLDLGPLTGANIEFFARMGCRVQVEDVVASLETVDSGEGPPVDPTRAAAPAATADGPPAADRPAPPEPPVGRQAEARPPAGAATAAPRSPGRVPSSRPTRHIVLPPRHLPRSGGVAPRAGAAPQPLRPAGPPGGAAAGPPLPTAFDYADETFDAIVAWDVFNYYAPVAARQVAAESRRILKPEGLILSLFHARQASGPEWPHRYQILEETRLASRELSCAPLPRQLFQNRDIEKMFTGLKIIELYFLKSAVREILMQKKPAAGDPAPPARPGTPKPRFTLE